MHFSDGSNDNNSTTINSNNGKSNSGSSNHITKNDSNYTDENIINHLTTSTTYIEQQENSNGSSGSHNSRHNTNENSLNNDNSSCNSNTSSYALTQLNAHRDNSVVDGDNDDECEQILKIPTTYQNLIELVAENGDKYEERLRQHKNQLHPALW